MVPFPFITCSNALQTGQLVVAENIISGRRSPPNPLVTGDFLRGPDQGFKPGIGDRQLAVSDKTLDHSASRAGPEPMARNLPSALYLI